MYPVNEYWIATGLQLGAVVLLLIALYLLRRKRIRKELL